MNLFDKIFKPEALTNVILILIELILGDSLNFYVYGHFVDMYIEIIKSHGTGITEGCELPCGHWN